MKKDKWYIPEKLFCDALSSGQILINTPAIGVAPYIVRINKNGDCWVTGYNIAKYYFEHMCDVPHRAFLTDEQKKYSMK